jgi:hypothetical protein
VTITPEVRYAKSGDVSIAYVDVGDGPPLIFVPGFISHVERGEHHVKGVEEPVTVYAAT